MSKFRVINGVNSLGSKAQREDSAEEFMRKQSEDIRELMKGRSKPLTLEEQQFHAIDTLKPGYALDRKLEKLDKLIEERDRRAKAPNSETAKMPDSEATKTPENLYKTETKVAPAQPEPEEQGPRENQKPISLGPMTEKEQDTLNRIFNKEK